MLIDVDHVPQDLLGTDVLTAGTRRPYTHSLTTALLLCAASAAARSPRTRQAATGAALGVLLHLWRDLATGGASIVWPVSTRLVTAPYVVYIVSLATAAAARPAVRLLGR